MSSNVEMANASRSEDHPMIDSAARRVTLRAAADCTRCEELRRLLREFRRYANDQFAVIELDLAAVRAMNCSLLATVLVMLRESRSGQRHLILRNVPGNFHHWASVCGVRPLLEHMGALTN